MRISPLAVALVACACPLLASAQDESLQVQSMRADEQIILSQIMTDKRAVYAQALQFTDEESRAFWLVYDEYEAKVKRIDDRFIRLVDASPLKFASFELLPIRPLRLIANRLTREFTTAAVRCVMEPR